MGRRRREVNDLSNDIKKELLADFEDKRWDVKVEPILRFNATTKDYVLNYMVSYKTIENDVLEHPHAILDENVEIIRMWEGVTSKKHRKREVSGGGDGAGKTFVIFCF